MNKLSKRIKNRLKWMVDKDIEFPGPLYVIREQMYNYTNSKVSLKIRNVMPLLFDVIMIFRTIRMGLDRNHE